MLRFTGWPKPKCVREMLGERINTVKTLGFCVVFAVFLGACAGIGGPAPGDQANTAGRRFTTEAVSQQIRVSAERGIRWSPAELAAQAGDVTFIVTNPTALNHTFVLEGNGLNVRSDVLRPGSTTNLTLTGLAPGQYRYICSVLGHEATMVGTLVVT